MTQAFNLSQLANKVNSTGQLDASTGLTNATPVANGGTGLSTTPTNGKLLIGNGTGYTLANLTAGANMTITNAAGSITLNSTSQSGANSRLFTSSGTFTVPDGVTSVKVTVFGGGGGGATSGFGGPNTASGGFGGVAVGFYTVTPLAVISATVGVGGVGVYSTSASALGGNGGASSFGSLISASGGTGGSAGSTSVNGTDGIGTNGTISNYITTAGISGFAGSTTRMVDVQTALVWSATSSFMPGAQGFYVNRPAYGFVGTGGVGGAVLVEW